MGQGPYVAIVWGVRIKGHREEKALSAMRTKTGVVDDLGNSLTSFHKDLKKHPRMRSGYNKAGDWLGVAVGCSDGNLALDWRCPDMTDKGPMPLRLSARPDGVYGKEIQKALEAWERFRTFCVRFIQVDPGLGQLLLVAGAD